ncbi:DUF2142 domain-containing protein [Luteimonas aquatica]|uniref:DUF2142 domain-containing protein n=1 Tax=Luteimonas aquatica TaxID=450364 RepID=UPI001F58D966|nr:DUF2142 domain-containing protein [Luteimonas aquatica]
MRWAIALLLLLLATIVLYANQRRQVEVAFSAQANASGWLQVFHDARGQYAETRSQWLKLETGPARAQGFDARGREAAWLRLDPPLKAETRLCGLRIGQSGAAGEYEIRQADETAVALEEGCLRMRPADGARDPKVVVRFVGRSAEKLARAQVWQRVFLVAAGLLVLALAAAAYACRASLAAAAAAMPAVKGFAVLERRLHWIAAAMMLALGTAYVLATPPGAVPDEEAHLAKIVRISQGVAFGDSGTRPMPDPRAMYGPFSDYLVNKQPFTRQQLSAQLDRPLACAPTGAGLAKGANGYFPHQYVLSSLWFKAACAGGMRFGQFLYGARMLNLLLATALVAWGLAYAARGKWALFLIAFLPMTLSQMSSLSADSLTLSLSVAWLGLISGIAGGRLDPARAAPALWTLSLAIAFLKPGTAWVLACLLFCKPAYDRAGVSYLGALLRHLALPWLVHIAWTLSARGDAQPLQGVDWTANLHALLEHPARFPLALARTMTGEHAVLLLQRMIGVLGWLDVKLSAWTYWTAGAMLLAAFWANDAARGRPPRYVMPLAAAMALGSVVVVALPLFIYWTPADSPVVQGLQGRYFTVTAAFALTWCAFGVPAGLRSVLGWAFVAVAVAINIDAVYRLHEAYFVVGRP